MCFLKLSDQPGDGAHEWEKNSEELFSNSTKNHNNRDILEYQVFPWVSVEKNEIAFKQHRNETDKLNRENSCSLTHDCVASPDILNLHHNTTLLYSRRPTFCPLEYVLFVVSFLFFRISLYQ